jgi:hypothetical protein
MKGPTGPRVLRPNGGSLPRKSWRQRAAEAAIGLKLDPAPEDDDTLAPRNRIPAAAEYIRPRFAWEIERWPKWGLLRYRDGVCTNWQSVTRGRCWRRELE